MRNTPLGLKDFQALGLFKLGRSLPEFLDDGSQEQSIMLLRMQVFVSETSPHGTPT